MGGRDAVTSHSGSNGSDLHSGSQSASPAPSLVPPASPRHSPLPAPPQVPPVAPQAPVRHSTRSRVPANVWRSNWYKAAYRPEQHRVAPPPLPAPQYRDPAPPVPLSSDENQGTDDSAEDSEESELLASDVAYFTLPEALEFAFKAGSHDDSPRTYAEAMTRPEAEQYHTSACDEIQTLLDNGTWELALLPPGRKAIGCRWVFTIKRKSDGSFDRLKGRLVAKGFSQRPGFDYEETYASTVKWATLRAILAYAALEDLEIESIDISSAFLNGDIDAEVYMDQPEGFPQGSPEQVLLLNDLMFDSAYLVDT